jgi:hypothetical protein
LAGGERATAAFRSHRLGGQGLEEREEKEAREDFFFTTVFILVLTCKFRSGHLHL